MRPSFDVEGSKTPTYRKRHAVDGMTFVRRKRHVKKSIVHVCRPCSYYSCTNPAWWGVLAGGAGTTCDGRKDSIVEGSLANFRALCRVPRCGNYSNWGLDGKQPSHCRDHGPLKDGLVLTAVDKSIPRSSSYLHSEAPLFHAKTEGSF